jgi:hypothetical protein
MAPKKRIVYVNLYDQVNPFTSQLGKFAVWHEDEHTARDVFARGCVAVAVPVEIEE